MVLGDPNPLSKARYVPGVLWMVFHRCSLAYLTKRAVGSLFKAGIPSLPNSVPFLDGEPAEFEDLGLVSEAGEHFL